MDGARVARGICHLSEAFGCSHVSGLWMRPLWPLALMYSADRVPTKSTRLSIAWHFAGSPDRRSQPFRINVVITPAIRDATVTSTSPLLSPLDGSRELRRSIGSALGQQRPSDARHLVARPRGTQHKQLQHRIPTLRLRSLAGIHPVNSFGWSVLPTSRFLPP